LLGRAAQSFEAFARDELGSNALGEGEETMIGASG